MKNSANYIVVILGILFFLDIITTFWGVVEIKNGIETNKMTLFLFDNLGYGSSFILISVFDSLVLLFIFKMINKGNSILFLVGSWVGIFFILLWFPTVISNLRIVFA